MVQSDSPQNNRSRILFYCQSLVGIGHLTASLQVIHELLEHSDVDLIYGGHHIDISIDHSGFRHIYLPAILINDETDQLYDPCFGFSIEQLFALRNQVIAEFLGHPYHAVIVEFFPFGRRRLKKEILGLFDTVKIKNPTIPIFSFVREVLVPADKEAEQRMVKSVLDDFHTVFVRGDPNVIRFDQTFSLTDRISHKLDYIGYLGGELPANRPPRTDQILVSQGGGRIGLKLLEAVIRAAPNIPEYDFLIATGSRTTEADFADLGKRVASSNVRIVPFLKEFKRHLMTSALSISMGGDNTLNDVINTRTPGLAYPYPSNSEQRIRIEKLSDKGFISMLSETDLIPENLRVKILDTLNKIHPEMTIANNGAVNMSNKIKSILGHR